MEQLNKKKNYQKVQNPSMWQGRNWTGTWYNEDLQKGIDTMLSECQYFMGQVEMCPETSREHLQWFAHFSRNQRITKLKSLLPGVHAELARNTQSCIGYLNLYIVIDYCSKDETRIRGPYTIGVSPVMRQKSGKKLLTSEALLLSEDELRELSVQSFITAKKAIAMCLYTPLETEKVRGQWFYGPPGTGKSYQARLRYPGAYIKAQSKWFDGYQNQSAIILDDLDGIKGSVFIAELGHLLKIVSDRYGCYGEIKGGTVALRHEVFVVTSNYLPEDLWPDAQLQLAIRRRFDFQSFQDPFDVLKPRFTPIVQE